MHHANLIVGKADWAMSVLPEEIRVENLDTLVFNFDRMSIAEVRKLIQEAGLRPIQSDYRSFIVYAQQILPEAQNALLKLFEEPNEHTVFYLVLPREDILLPTLRSRLILFAREEMSREKNDSFTYFLAMSYAERIEAIAVQLKKEDTEWVQRIVEGFSLHAHNAKNPELMRESLILESNINTNGAAKKMLLEHAALCL